MDSHPHGSRSAAGDRRRDGGGPGHRATERALEMAGVSPVSSTPRLRHLEPDHFVRERVYLHACWDLHDPCSRVRRNAAFIYARRGRCLDSQRSVSQRSRGLVGDPVPGLEVSSAAGRRGHFAVGPAPSSWSGEADTEVFLLSTSTLKEHTRRSCGWKPWTMYHPECPRAIDAGDTFSNGRREVFRHAVARMPERSAPFCRRLGTRWKARPPAGPSCQPPIAEARQKELKLRDDQVYNNIMRYGTPPPPPFRSAG